MKRLLDHLRAWFRIDRPVCPSCGQWYDGDMDRHYDGPMHRSEP